MSRASLFGLPRRTAIAFLLFLAVMLALPLFIGDYLLSVFIIFLFAAYLGQAWNIMMGFAGQLSLGHALYVGLGAYLAAALFTHFGLPPWIGMIAGMAVAGLVGTVIGALSFRFGVAGVYFALITIAFNEFTRILFDHLDWFGGSAGLFLHVVTVTHDDPWHLRGSPAMFYYLLLAMVLAVLGLSRLLLRRRVGYYWLAIREDPAAGEALGINVFGYKLGAVALSAMLTAVAGGVMAFYNNNLYPDNVFTTASSVQIITAPFVGGIGTLFGPILGAFVLTGLGEVMTSVSAVFGIAGLKQWLYGAALLAIIIMQPAGLWPWLRRRLRIGEG
ncbi:MAG TPA: branched-chain amino acid ABC transporter permease [Stellaceae bacterium]|nr:branched-chain amino acid ABC transporter permease [Stellaceae bacterium]